MTVLVRDPEKPLELIVRDYNETVGYACPKCGRIFVPSAQCAHPAIEAAEHCRVSTCACGAPKRSGSLRCRSCAIKAFAEAHKKEEEERFAKAKKVKIEDYSDPLYCEGYIGDLGDGYFSSVDILLDRCEERDLDVPTFVWACTPVKLKLSADQILGEALSFHQMHQNVGDIPQADRTDLQACLDIWIGGLKLTSWHVDHSRAVILLED